MTISLTSQGYTDSSDGTWKVYLKWGESKTKTGGSTITDPDYGTVAGTSSVTWSVNNESFCGFAYSRLYHGNVSGATVEGSDSSDCQLWPLETEATETCANTGTSTWAVSDTKSWGGPPANIESGLSYTVTETIMSAEGDETEAYAAWSALYPNPGDYEAAVSAYEAYLVASAAWQAAEPDPGDFETPEEYDAAYASWLEEEPAAVAEPDPEPQEFYGPCDFKIISEITVENWYFGKNSDGSSAAPPTDQEDLDAWWSSVGSGSAPCPGTSSKTLYGYSCSYLLVNPYESADPPTVVSSTGYTDGMTYSEWVAEAQSVIGAVEFNESCVFDNQCFAARETDQLPGGGSGDSDDEINESISESVFRYRWKLNKCCGPYSALSWLEVFYSKDFLEWLANGGSGNAPDIPTSTPKAWTLTDGVVPPECWDSGGSDDSSSSDAPLDPFDDESFWSPWSLPVRIPGGQDGTILLRELYMTCYRSPFGTVPDYIPLLGHYDSSDLDEDGIPDSAQ